MNGKQKISARPSVVMVSLLNKKTKKKNEKSHQIRAIEKNQLIYLSIFYLYIFKIYLVCNK